MNKQLALKGHTQMSQTFRPLQALRLGHFLGTSPEFWMNLQMLYDLRLAESKSGETIREVLQKAQ